MKGSLSEVEGSLISSTRLVDPMQFLGAQVGFIEIAVVGGVVVWFIWGPSLSDLLNGALNIAGQVGSMGAAAVGGLGGMVSAAPANAVKGALKGFTGLVGMVNPMGGDWSAGGIAYRAANLINPGGYIANEVTKAIGIPNPVPSPANIARDVGGAVGSVFGF